LTLGGYAGESEGVCGGERGEEEEGNEEKDHNNSEENTIASRTATISFRPDEEAEDVEVAGRGK